MRELGLKLVVGRGAGLTLVQRAHDCADQIGEQLLLILVHKPEIGAFPALKIDRSEEKEPGQFPFVKAFLFDRPIDPTHHPRMSEESMAVQGRVRVSQNPDELRPVVRMLLDVL